MLLWHCLQCLAIHRALQTQTLPIPSVTGDAFLMALLHAVIVSDDLTGPGDSSEVRRRNSPKGKDFLSSPSYKSFYSFPFSCLDLLTLPLSGITPGGKPENR